LKIHVIFRTRGFPAPGYAAALQPYYGIGGVTTEMSREFKAQEARRG